MPCYHLTLTKIDKSRGGYQSSEDVARTHQKESTEMGCDSLHMHPVFKMWTSFKRKKSFKMWTSFKRKKSFPSGDRILSFKSSSLRNWSTTSPLWVISHLMCTNFILRMRT